LNLYPDDENKGVKMEEVLKNEETQKQEAPESVEDETAIAGPRIAELEQVVSEKDTEIENLKHAGKELEERCRTLEKSLTDAVTGYKALVIKSNPDIIDDLINGDTIESINESLEKARTLVSRIRQGMEDEISKVKVPAGAPERSSPDLSTLSPAEKIRYAIGGNE
jgi:molecular chaperone GrpE (heat shock protein)